jgi:hypothetical protein
MTYGLRIPGYSYPSSAQEKYYKKHRPQEYADHVEKMHQDHSDNMAHYKKYQEWQKAGYPEGGMK